MGRGSAAMAACTLATLSASELTHCRPAAWARASRSPRGRRKGVTCGKPWRRGACASAGAGSVSVATNSIASGADSASAGDRLTSESTGASAGRAKYERGAGVSLLGAPTAVVTLPSAVMAPGSSVARGAADSPSRSTGRSRRSRSPRPPRSPRGRRSRRSSLGAASCVVPGAASAGRLAAACAAWALAALSCGGASPRSWRPRRPSPRSPRGGRALAALPWSDVAASLTAVLAPASAATASRRSRGPWRSPRSPRSLVRRLPSRGPLRLSP